MVSNPKEVSNYFFSHHKEKRSKGRRKKVDMSQIECYQCHKKGHHKSDCLEDPKNKKRGRDQATLKKETQRNSSLKNMTLGTYTIKSFSLHNLFLYVLEFIVFLTYFGKDIFVLSL